MNRSSYFSGIKRATTLFLTVCTLSFVCLFWIISSTVLNSAFYSGITQSGEVLASFDTASQKMSAGTVQISSPSIQNNLIALIDGVIRYITQKDMSLSDISLENIDVASICSDVLMQSADTVPEIPDVSRIHPYILTYFFPGQENITSLFYSLQTGFTLIHSLYPVICLIVLSLVFLSKSPSEKLRITFIASGWILIASGLSIRIMQKALFADPLSAVFPDDLPFISPMLQEISFRFFVRCLIFSVLLFAISLFLRLKPMQKALDSASKHIAFTLLAGLVLLFILFGREMSQDFVHVLNNSQQQQIEALYQGEGTHSLIIKLREEGTNMPIPDIKLVLVKLDSPQSDWITLYSDDTGNARFIVPQGQYFIYVDESTVPSGSIPFTPVTFTLDKPDSSWYTLYFSKKTLSQLRRENQTPELSRTPNRLTPEFQ